MGFEECAHEGCWCGTGVGFIFDRVEGAEEEIALAVVASALGAFPWGEPFGQASQLGHDVCEVCGGGNGVEEGVRVGGDGGGVVDATEGEAGYDSTCVAFHDQFEVGGVVEELGEELVAFLQWEELVGYGCGLGHEFMDEFSLAAPCVCRKGKGG